MQRRLFSVIILIISFLFLFCQKEKNIMEPSGNFSEFSLKVGSSWKYAVTDTIIHTYTGEREIEKYTVTVTIVDSLTAPNGGVITVWQYTYPDKKDTLYVTLSGDTLLFYIDKKCQILHAGFLLNSHLNDEWFFSGREYKVVEVSDVRVPAGVFKDVPKIREIIWQGNALGYNYYFFTPEAGFVKIYYGIFVTLFEINHITNWELVYHSSK